MKVRRELSARDIDELHRSLARRLGDTSIPTLPQVAMRIIELVSDPNSSVNDFSETIKTDQALTGRLLRMANSAAFGQRNPVTKVERAMVLLGLEKLKSLALGFHLSQAAFDAGDFSIQRVWTQSLFRGWLASRLAERYDQKRSGEAFIIGLLNDAGIPMMPKLVGTGYANTINSNESPAKQYLTETMQLSYTHVDVAVALCSIWKLPEVLSRPIASHHDAPSSMDPKNSTSLLQAIAYFVGMIPLDPNGQFTVCQPVTSIAKRLFDLEPDEVVTLLQLAGEDFEKCRAVFADVIDDTLSIERILSSASEHIEVTEDVEASAPKEDSEPAPVLRYSVGDQGLELEPSGEGRVTAYLTDVQGNRILSESIDPNAQSEQEIRAALLLTDAPQDQVNDVLTGLRKMAA